MDAHVVFELPRLGRLVRRTLPQLVESTLGPLALFWVTLRLAGVWGALAAALVWSYGALAFRLATGRRIPGMLALGALLLTARTVVALLAQSAYLYFLQPTLGTILVAGLFLVSVPAGRPMAERLAQDFFPIPAAIGDRPAVRRFFARVTLLWAGAHLTNAALNIWLLLSQELGTYVLLKSVVSLTVTGGAITLSTLWFRHSMRREGVHVRFEPRLAAGPPAPAVVGV